MQFLILVCIFGHIISLVATEALKYECPEPEDIFPCYCEEEDDDPTVFCNHLTTTDQLYDGVQGLKGHEIYRATFFRNWILQPIKSDAFKDLAIQKLMFENSTISFSPPQFKGLENSLNSLQMRAIFNKTNPIVSLDLGHLKKLREIILEKNKITNLPNDWLKNPPESLRSVSVEYNTIITMDDEVFSTINHLTFLVLEANRLVTIKRSMFPKPAESLRSLNLNNNKIRYLPYDIFSEMPNLRSLEMSGNRLTTLEKDIWSDVMSQLTKLDVLDNPLECDNSLKWMYNGHRRPAILEGRCELPERLRNKSLFVLTLSDFS